MFGKRGKWILALAALGCLIVSFVVGRYPLSLGEIGRILLGQDADSVPARVFLNIRLPRALIVSVCGMGLAVAGQIFQRVFVNPLVSPDVLGVSGGCSVGAVAAILAGAGMWATQAFAFMGGLCAVGLSILLARAIRGERRISMILSGIIIGALANAVIMFFKYVADPTNELATIEYWLMGSFHTARWVDLRLLVPMTAICFLGLFLLRYPIQIIALGDEEAKSLGVNVPRVRAVALFLATALVAASVCVAGIVSWVGLIVPHMVRRVSHRDSTLFIESAMGGAAVLTVADALARSIATAEIPISILTSLMGAIFLAAVLLARQRGTARD